MGRRCDKCRVEYESGVDYGGKDYCMTCYIRVREEEAKKKKDEIELLRRREADRQRVRERSDERSAYAKQKMRDELERKLYELKKSDLILKSSPDRKKAEEEMRKRAYYGWRPKWDRAKAVEAPATAVEGRRRSSVLSAPAPKMAPEKPYMPQQQASAGFTAHLPPEESEIVRVAVSVTKGLPVSLSVGQKENTVIFSGKNESSKKITLELAVSIADFKKRAVDAVVDPKQQTLGIYGEGQFAVKFDLKDDTPTGPLTLSAQLKENAVYVDRQAAKSETLTLQSQVKTPLELVYRRAAKFEGKGGELALCLLFENVGESGGLLSRQSSAVYGSEGHMIPSKLLKQAKVKGKQKKVELQFGPAEKCGLQRISFELFGVDSNGKEYKKQETVLEKEEKKKGKKDGQE